jgi:hypothetical protein
MKELIEFAKDLAGALLVLAIFLTFVVTGKLNDK